MIDEVAILCGHDNDGQLSYRDYVRCLECNAARFRSPSVARATSAHGRSFQHGPRIPRAAEIAVLVPRCAADRSAAPLMTADEREKNAVNAEIDAIIERKSQQDEGEADGADEDIVHMRGSSFATLDTWWHAAASRALSRLARARAERACARTPTPAPTAPHRYLRCD